MVWKIGLVKQVEGNQVIKLFLNVECESVEDAISEALKLAKKYNATVDFIDELIQGYIDVPMEKLLKKIVNSESKPKGGIYG
ncbi:MAG: hypothetical protein NDF54_10325 [archaeon GB-1867-035]|nr:hypothetical protein [Candidatus Culexmicrobium profundum]